VTAALFAVGSARAADEYQMSVSRVGKSKIVEINRIPTAAPVVPAAPARVQPPATKPDDKKADDKKPDVVRKADEKRVVEGVFDEAPSKCALTAHDWTCGRCFFDDLGRRWCLIQGPPLSEKPAQLIGWYMPAVEGRYYFLTEGGRMYCTQPRLLP